MRPRALAAVALLMQLGAVELKVDHVTVAGRDLAALQKAFEAVGLPSEFGGKHTNGMTQMAIASFADGSYLELIASQPGANVAAHYWGPFIEQQAGACAWAVSVPDIRAEAGRLKQAGLEIVPAPSGRRRPDGVALRWTSAGVGPGPQGSFFPFLIQDDTPRPLRVYPHGKESVTQFSGVALVVIAVADLESAIAKWRAAFSLPEPERGADTTLRARLAWFPSTPVMLASPEPSGLWLTQRLQQFGEAPFAFVLRGNRIPPNAQLGRAAWFGHPIGWFDPATLKGARIGVWLK